LVIPFLSLASSLPVALAIEVTKHKQQRPHSIINMVDSVMQSVPEAVAQINNNEPTPNILKKDEVTVAQLLQVHQQQQTHAHKQHEHASVAAAVAASHSTESHKSHQTQTHRIKARTAAAGGGGGAGIFLLFPLLASFRLLSCFVFVLLDFLPNRS
jgi:hypothetical protein